MSRTIDYYYSLASPWAYIGHATFMDIARRHGLAVRHKPVFLGAVFAETGVAAVGEASSRAPALPDARIAALARPARPRIPPSAAPLAVRPVIRRPLRDRGRSRRARPRPVPAPRLCRDLGGGARPRRPGRHRRSRARGGPRPPPAARPRPRPGDGDALRPPPDRGGRGRRVRARPPTSSTARCSGARTASTSSTTRCRSGARPTRPPPERCCVGATPCHILRQPGSAPPSSPA